jgi:hypothetical protein
MGSWVLLSLFAGGVVGFLFGLNSASSIVLAILGFLGIGFFLDLVFQVPSDLMWQCEHLYPLETPQKESCLLHANSFRWYLFAAGLGVAAGLFFGHSVHEKMEERKRAS